MAKWIYLALAAIVILGIGMRASLTTRSASARERWINDFIGKQEIKLRDPLNASKCSSIIKKARAMTKSGIHYDPGYYKLSYPGGDVAEDKGVCADVVVRSLREIGLDLQQLIHEDMGKDFSKYPNLWSLGGPDSNIDHRRVPNMMMYFNRRYGALPLEKDFAPCDIVAWDLGGGITHIGIVSDQLASARPFIIHHIGGRPSEEDVLFAWRIIGHYRLF